MIYLCGIIFFSLLLVICIILFCYYVKDEKNLVEVTDRELQKLGKNYSKKVFENKMFEQYKDILLNTIYENYTILKDTVSDQIYNQILLSVKNDKEQQKQSVISDINKEFSKLIYFEVIDDLEIAKLWVRYSSIEYKKQIQKKYENDQEVFVEVVVEGNREKPKEQEYILTFVRNRTQTENIVCPSCGEPFNILTSSNCTHCDSFIVPKKMHWVFVEKKESNLSNHR